MRIEIGQSYESHLELRESVTGSFSVFFPKANDGEGGYGFIEATVVNDPATGPTVVIRGPADCQRRVKVIRKIEAIV